MTSSDWALDIRVGVEAEHAKRQRLTKARDDIWMQEARGAAAQRKAQDERYRRTPAYESEQEAEVARRNAERQAAFDPKNDPFREPDWTVAQALAWIIWRTAEDVRRFSRRVVRTADESRGEDSALLPGASPGDVWDDAAVEANIKIDRAWHQIMSGSEARDELWRALKAGALQAHGICPDLRRRASIPEREWCDLDLLKGLVDGDSVARFESTNVEYRDVRLLREQVLSRWVGEQAARNWTSKEIDHPVATMQTKTERSVSRKIAEIMKVARELWPTSDDVPARVYDRDARLKKWFQSQSRVAPSPKSFQRAFAELDRTSR